VADQATVETQPLPLAKARQRLSREQQKVTKQAAREARQARAVAEALEKETKREARRTEKAAQQEARRATSAAIAADAELGAAAMSEPTTEPAADWHETFFATFAKTGSKSKAATAAGVSLTTVRRHEQQDTAFTEQMALARQVWVEHLESLLYSQAKDKNNAIAGLALLKRWCPENYEDRLRVEGALKHLHGVAPIPPEAASQLLRAMLLEATDVSRDRLLAASTPLALPVVIEGEVIRSETVSNEAAATEASS
jgi:hypothetical protein